MNKKSAVLQTRFALAAILFTVISAETAARPEKSRCNDPSQNERIADTLSKLKADPTAALKALFEREWEYALKESPEFATWVGDPRYQDDLTDQSMPAIERRRVHERCLLEELETMGPDSFKLESDRLNYDLFTREARLSVEGQRFPSEVLVVTQMGGPHTGLADLLKEMRHVSGEDYDHILRRLEKAEGMIGQSTDLLKRGLELKVTPARLTLSKVPDAIEPLLAPNLDKNPLYEVFREIPETIPPTEKKRIQDEAALTLNTKVLPALKRFREFLKDTYIPQARTSLAWREVPDGEAWYQKLIKEHTTTSLTAREIHQIGLSEVERIKAEMLKVMKASGFKKSLAEYFHFLRTDPRFFYRTGDELLAGYRDIAKRIDPELVRLFGKLPRLPYGVKAISAYSERRAPTAYYTGGSPEANRAGWFTANTYNLKARPKWEMEPLTAHEAVPGHHLQIALAQELVNVPRFRRILGYTAFTEGWGLYAESLGQELGLYKTHESRMGQLTYEMWRACRLVVDTGIHELGWSREKAIAFMREAMPKPLHDIEVEVDRYIVWPGQALAYKIGELKFKELRAKATRELGAKFDVRAFHDEVLAEGALPMDVLEKRMNEWIESKKTSPSAEKK
jgi:uncharacterized protein (DUF885 family)